MQSSNEKDDVEEADEQMSPEAMDRQASELEALEKAKAELAEERAEKNRKRSITRKEKYGEYLSTQHHPKILQRFKEKCKQQRFSQKEVIGLLVRAYVRGDISITKNKAQLNSKG